MESELALHPDDAGRLLQLKLLAPARAGPARTQPMRIIWHDSPDRLLAAQSLILAEVRGKWRLERLFPARNHVWPPGAPAPLLQEADTLAELTHSLPMSLAPIAAFEGRQTIVPLQAESVPLTLLLQRGMLRAVTAEHARCRLVVTGDEPAVRALASSLAAELRLSVPRAALAAEALAIADRVATRPRQTGAPELPDDARESVAAAFRHVLGHLTDVLLHQGHAAISHHEDTEPVHQMRVAMRRARSAIAVFRTALGCPELTAANDQLKALGARLGPARDWDVFVTETAAAVSEAVPHDARLTRMIAAAERRRREARATLLAWLSGPEFRLLCIELAWMAGSGSWVEAVGPAEQASLGMPLADFADGVLQRRWKKLLAAGKQIETLDIPALHALRLRTKRARYSAELFSALYPGKATRRFIRRLSVLQENLGVLNDGAVAGQLMEEIGGKGGRHAYATGLLLGFASSAASTIRPRILRAWGKLQHQSPFWA